MGLKAKKSLLFQKIRKNISTLAAPVCRTLNTRKHRSIAPLNKNIEIDINNVYGWYRGNRYSQITYPGQIKGGDWSGRITEKNKALKNSSKFRAIVERYEKGLQWKETELFKKRYRADLDRGKKINGLENLKEIEMYYREYYDKLYMNLKINGVIEASKSRPEIAPIYIHIGENGEILYTVDGNHRLYMCMVLGIESIPVRVWLRHEKWQQKREILFGEKKTDLQSDLIDKYSTHPDIISEIKINEEY
jgi:hypothetical protein